MQVFVIYQDGYLGSREQAASLADKTLGIAKRLGHLGAEFLVLIDRIRRAAMLGDLPQVEALGPQIVDIGERGGLPWRYMGHLYLGLAAHWRGNTEQAEAELRKAVELEPPGAFAGLSAAVLARHLAYHGRADEVMELFESGRSKLPSLDRVNGLGSWSWLLNFVEACYLCDLYDQAASLAPLVERALELLGRSYVTHDGRLVDTVPVSPLRRLAGGRKPNATSASHGRSPHRCPTGSSWPTCPGCTPGCCWIVATLATTSEPPRCSRRLCPLTARLACLPTPLRRNAYGVWRWLSGVARTGWYVPPPGAVAERAGPLGGRVWHVLAAQPHRQERPLHSAL